MLAARYSSWSSGSAPCPRWASNSACFVSKLSEMYLRKIRPRTTCLYSAASMLDRSLSAASQSLASKPMLAELLVFAAALARGIGGAQNSRKGKERKKYEGQIMN